MLASDVHHPAAGERDRHMMQSVAKAEAKQGAGLDNLDGLKQPRAINPWSDERAPLCPRPIPIARWDLQSGRHKSGRLVNVCHRDLTVRLAPANGGKGGRFKQGKLGRGHFFAEFAFC
jgi:hypothetical protein